MKRIVFCAVFLALMIWAGCAWAGGPLILAGHDADDHGFESVYAGLFNFVLSNTHNGGSGILAVGADEGTDAGNWIEAVAGLMSSPQTVTFVNNGDISTVDFSGYAILFIPSDIGDTGGGITQDENDLLVARAADIAVYVNCGGGLFGFTQGQFANAYGYLALEGGFTTLSVNASGSLPSGGIFGNVTATTEGMALGITDTGIDGCCFHNVFLTFPSYLKVLATANTPAAGDEAFHGQAVVLGGAAVIFPPILTCPDPVTVPCGGEVTLTAHVKDAGCHGDVTVQWYVDDVLVETDVLSGEPIDSDVSLTHAFSSAGEHAVAAVATNEPESSSRCETTVAVESEGTLEIACSVRKAMLWPPNHNLVNVGLTASAEGSCEGLISGDEISVRVYADEDDQHSTGDGNHSPDAKNIAPGALRLRSERKGNSNGRVYLIIAKATDSSGNVRFESCTAVVPRSQSKTAIASVKAQAAAAKAYCDNHDGAPPPGFYVIGDGPVIGPKQ